MHGVAKEGIYFILVFKVSLSADDAEMFALAFLFWVTLYIRTFIRKTKIHDYSQIKFSMTNRSHNDNYVTSTKFRFRVLRISKFVVTVLQGFDTDSIVWNFQAFNVGICFHLDLLIGVKYFSSEPLFECGKE